MDSRSEKEEKQEKRNEYFKLGEPVFITYMNNLPGFIIGVLGDGSVDVGTSAGVIHTTQNNLRKV